MASELIRMGARFLCIFFLNNLISGKHIDHKEVLYTYPFDLELELELVLSKV